MGGQLSVAGTASLQSNLTVACGASFGAAVRLADGLSATGNISCCNMAAAGDLMVTGAASLQGVLNVAGDASIAGGLSTAGTANLLSNVVVAGDGSFGAAVRVGGDLSTACNFTSYGTLAVAQGAAFGGNVIAVGDLTSHGALTVQKSAQLQSDLAVGSNLAVAGQITTTRITSDATGLVTIGGPGQRVDIQDQLAVASGIIAGGGLDVAGNAMLRQQLFVSCNATLGKDATVLGGLTVAGDLTGSNGMFSGGLTAVQPSSFGDVSANGLTACNAVISETLTASNGVFAGSVSASNLVAGAIDGVDGSLRIGCGSNSETINIGVGSSSSNPRTINIGSPGDIVVIGGTVSGPGGGSSSNATSTAGVASNGTTTTDYLYVNSNAVLTNQVTLGYGSNGATVCNASHSVVTGTGSIDVQQTMMIRDLVISGSITLSSNATIIGFPATGTGGGSGGDLIWLPTTGARCFWSNAASPPIGSQFAEYDGTLTVHENIYTCGSVFVGGSVHVTDLNVTQAVTFGSNMVASSATFSNDVVINGALSAASASFTEAVSIGGSLSVTSNLHFVDSNSSITHPGSLTISGGTVLKVEEPVVLNDVTVLGKLSLCNYSWSLPFTSWCNSPVPDYTQYMHNFSEDVCIDNDLYIGGTLFCKDIRILEVHVGTILTEPTIKGTAASFSSNIATPLLTTSNVTTQVLEFVDGSSNPPYWTEKLTVHSESNMSADLVLQSANGTQVTFTDEFTPEVLNFTAKHRCVYIPHKRGETDDSIIGKLVSTTGKYCDLSGKPTPIIDEAIPVVRITSEERDKKVFGVIGGFDDANEFRLGNLKFCNTNSITGRRAVVQALGEGLVWVVNFDGAPLENGDLLTSSPVPGFAMRQSDDLVRNYTVAKVTCDCKFPASKTASIPRVTTVAHAGKKYRAALVGCVYKM